MRVSSEGKREPVNLGAEVWEGGEAVWEGMVLSQLTGQGQAALTTARLCSL